MTLLLTAYTVRRMRYALVLALLSLARPAAAQIDDPFGKFYGGANGLDAAITEPQSPNLRIDCTFGQENCKPINKAVCDSIAGGASEARPIAATLVPDAGLIIPNGAVLYIWTEKETGSPSARCAAFTFNAQGTAGEGVALQQPVGQLTISNRSDISKVFPSVSSVDFLLTTGDFLQAGTNTNRILKDNCAIPVRQFYRLCFGIDMNAGVAGTTTNTVTVDTNEPLAWIRIFVDTQLPPPVTEVGVDTLDGRLHLHPVVGEPPQVRDTWLIASREVATPSPSGAFNCDNLDSSFETSTHDAFDTKEFDISGTNGLTLEGCVRLRDAAGNLGAAGTFAGAPVNECDFIECYPGELKGGICGAALGPAWAGLLVGLASLRRIVRRNRTRNRTQGDCR